MANEGTFDSFLSTVTKNGLGMLVLVAMASTFSSQLTLSQGRFQRNLGTPLVKKAPPGMTPVYYECADNRLRPVEWDSIRGEVSAFLDTFAPNREDLARQYNSRGLGNAYHTFEFKIRGGLRNAPDVPGVLMHPRAKDLGETLVQVKDANSAFRKRLKALDPGRHAVILFVRGDSFEFFRGVREILQQEGFRHGWHPLDEPLIVTAGGGGGLDTD
jgi:hypothetical protein